MDPKELNSKKIAILQSNYIPWKGYFDLINLVDEFVIFDDAQFTQIDYPDRNKIKTPDGPLWLTIPVETKGKFTQKIKDIKVSNKTWAKEHWETITINCAMSMYFLDYNEIFEDIYLNNKDTYLSEINFKFITAINNILGIKTRITSSSDYKIAEDKNERLLSICKSVDATDYYSIPTVKSYLNEELFNAENIKVHWMDYSGYPEYSQLYQPFEHQVSILDLIFNTGPNATKYMKTFKVKVL